MGIGEDGEELPLLNHGTSLDEHLLDTTPFDGGEVDADQRRHPGAQGKEVIEGTALDRRDGHAVGGDGLGVGAGRHRVEAGGGDEQQGAADAELYRLRQTPSLNDAIRSEEHTSELQSLIRIAYAVFCLKKKTLNYIHPCS